MSDEQNGRVDVYESRVFKKALDRLDNDEIYLVENEIDLIIADPEIGTQKAGDLNYLWVHKFPLNNRQVLLGYSWKEEQLEVYLLNIGPHENFYKEAKNRRKADLKLID
jgi:hypothetical protein